MEWIRKRNFLKGILWQTRQFCGSDWSLWICSWSKGHQLTTEEPVNTKQSPILYRRPSLDFCVLWTASMMPSCLWTLLSQSGKFCMQMQQHRPDWNCMTSHWISQRATQRRFGDYSSLLKPTPTSWPALLGKHTPRRSKLGSLSPNTMCDSIGGSPSIASLLLPSTWSSGTPKIIPSNIGLLYCLSPYLAILIHIELSQGLETMTAIQKPFIFDDEKNPNLNGMPLSSGNFFFTW